MGLFFRQAWGRVVFANEDRIVGFLGKAAIENSAAFCQARDENGFFGKIYPSGSFRSFLLCGSASDEPAEVCWIECDWGTDLCAVLDLAECFGRGTVCAYPSGKPLG